MTYISQDAPALAKKPEEHNDDTVSQETWDKLFKVILENDEMYEFHVYKVSFEVIFVSHHNFHLI